jgi:hypothetical protein
VSSDRAKGRIFRLVRNSDEGRELFGRVNESVNMSGCSIGSGVCLLMVAQKAAPTLRKILYPSKLVLTNLLLVTWTAAPMSSTALLLDDGAVRPIRGRMKGRPSINDGAFGDQRYVFQHDASLEAGGHGNASDDKKTSAVLLVPDGTESTEAPTVALGLTS